MTNLASTRKKVIIIGAGPGGLASAMLLAKSGCQVTVLEKQDQPGGRTSGISEQSFNFDRGPTFFLYPQALREIFTMCGRNLDEEIELIKLSHHYRLIFGEGGEIDAYPDLPQMMEQIKRLSSSDATQLPKFLLDNRAKLAAFQPILQSPMSDYRQLLRLSLLSALPLLRPWNSVERDLRRYFTDPRVRIAFSFQSKYLGMSPFRCPSLFTILSFLEYEYGIFHPRGGCAALSQTMARIAQELGAEIHVNEPVTAVKFNQRRAVGVTTARRDYSCDALVINADFAQAMIDLVPNHLRSRWTNEKLARKEYSCSTYMMYLGIDGVFPQLSHHTVYLSKDYHSNLNHIEKQHILSEDPSFYVANPVVTDPTMAPPGKSALYVLAPVTHLHPNVDWDGEKNRFYQLMLEQLTKIGINNIEKRLEFIKITTPEDWRHELNIYRGATFNLSHCWRQLLQGRPNNRFEDLQGVYLVGGGTHPGSGLPVIFESAKISSKLLLQDLQIKPQPVAEQATAAGVADF